jgi:type II secretory pathway pseudopilin PulG
MIADAKREGRYAGRPERRITGGGEGTCGPSHLPAFSPSGLHAPRAAAHGYTLAALMVMITVLMIGLAAAYQLWSSIIQRDNEEELIFRGLQYVRAIQLYQARNGRLPNKLDELMQMGPGKPRCIRKLFKDPMTPPDGKWGLLFSFGGSVTRWPVVVVPGMEVGTEGGPMQQQNPNSPFSGQPSGLGGGTGFLPQSGMQLKPLETTGAGGEGEAPVGPIVGVFSTSVKKSLRTYNARNYYCQWEFSLLGNGPGGQAGPGVNQGGQGNPLNNTGIGTGGKH